MYDPWRVVARGGSCQSRYLALLAARAVSTYCLQALPHHSPIYPTCMYVRIDDAVSGDI